jgi:hypothetical protein
MRRALWVVAGAACALASSASASTVLVSSRAALAGTDFIDWGQFGGEGTNFTNSSAGTTNNSLGFTVSKALSGDFGRLNQSSGWGGNFAPGDELLWTQNFEDNDNPVRIEFASDIGAGGAQIQADFFGAFRARIEAFDSSNTSLGSFLLDGDSNSNADNSAIFLGIRSSGIDIRAIELTVVSASSLRGDFAINQFDLGDAGPAIPLPHAAGLSLAGMGIVCGIRRRRVK